MPRRIERPIADVSFVEKALRKARKQKTIGDLVMWNLENVEIRPSVLATLLQKRGIEKWAPVDIRRGTAARKAIKQIRPMLEGGELRVLVRKVIEDDNEVRYAIVDEKTNMQRLDVDYSTRNQVVFDKKAGSLSFTKESIQPIVERFEILCGVYTTNELQRMILNVLNAHGALPFRDGTGIFFMPIAMKHVTDALYDLINEDIRTYAKHSVMKVFGVPNSEDDRQEVETIFRADLASDLTEASEFLATSMEATHKHREFVLQNALDRYRVLQGKTLMYKELLQIELTDVEKKLNTAVIKVNKAMGL